MSQHFRRLFKFAWVGGVCVYVLVLLYLVSKGKVLHFDGSPYELLRLYVPLGILGVLGLLWSIRDRSLLTPSGLLATTGTMGCLFALFLEQTGILMNYDDWVRSMPQMSLGTKLGWLSGYTVLFVVALAGVYKVTVVASGVPGKKKVPRQGGPNETT